MYDRLSGGSLGKPRQVHGNEKFCITGNREPQLRKGAAANIAICDLSRT